MTGRSDVSAEDCRRFHAMDQSGDGMIQQKSLCSLLVQVPDGPRRCKRICVTVLYACTSRDLLQKLEHTILYDRDFDDQHRAKKIVDEVWHKFDVDKSGTIEGMN